MESPVLIGKNVTFYSPVDESFFYKWIQNISIIERVEPSAENMLFHLKSNDISVLDLDRLVGLFARYAIDTKQLRIFLNEKNKPWLKYWV